MNAPAGGDRRATQARQSQARQKNGRFTRPDGAEEATVSGAELLDRLERQAGELGASQGRIAELERTLAEAREGGIKAAKALKAERRLRVAAEASLERMTQERDELSQALAEQRAAVIQLEEELRAANLQAEMLDERMRTVWAEAQGGEAERGQRRGLRRLARGGPSWTPPS
jgi:predicted negative regulator of RcsB-dependent stress response